MKRMMLALIFCMSGALLATEPIPTEQTEVSTQELLELIKKVPFYEEPQPQIQPEPPIQPVAACDTLCVSVDVPEAVERVLVNDPQSKGVAFFPDPSVDNSAELPPQTVIDFNVGDAATSPSFITPLPVDPMIAVGPDQFIAASNRGLTTFNKVGERAGTLDTDAITFFNLNRSTTSNSSAAQHPRIRYDRFTDRFFVVYRSRTTGSDDMTLSGLSIAVSDRGDLTDETRWKVVNILNLNTIPDADGCPPQNLREYFVPTLGIDKHALYIGINTNVFGIAHTNTSSDAFVIQKKSLLRNSDVIITAFRNVTGFPGGTRLQGVDNFDKDSQFGYFICTNPRKLGSLLLFKVLCPGSESPGLTDPIEIIVPKTGYRSLAPAGPDPVEFDLPIFQNVDYDGNEFGDAGKLNPGFLKLEMAHIRNKQLFTCQMTQVDQNGVGTGKSSDPDSRIGVRWYQIDLTGDPRGKACEKEKVCTDPALVQAGTVWDPNIFNNLRNDYYLPAIMTNMRGDLALCGNVSGKTQASSAFFTGRTKKDTLGTLRIGNSLNDIVYKEGMGQHSQLLDPTLGNPWGGYSYTSLDPEDELTMWTIQSVVFNGLERLTVGRLEAPAIPH